MPALINELEDGGLFKVRVKFDDVFDEKDPSEKELAKRWAGHWVDLREPNAKEQASMATAENRADWFVDALPALIQKHSFVDADGNAVETARVAKVIANSSTVFSKVMGEYVNSLPFVKRIAGSSDRPPMESSPAAPSTTTSPGSGSPSSM